MVKLGKFSLITVLTRWLGKLFGHKQDSARVIPRSQHTISRKDLSSTAIKVLYRLKNRGYEAYLVGGGVRDLLLGLHPKDFDVVTNATPEQVARVFSNCRLIGRRFRLAHIHFGREIIEVATFRGPGAESSSELLTSEKGMLLRDNIYGSRQEDAYRRDFTINALYYNIADFSLLDYVDALSDLKNKTIRLIGSAETRFIEDPVRMLRAIRFAGKLEFSIAVDAEEQIYKHRNLLKEIPHARLLEEVIKLFFIGNGVITLGLLQKYRILEIILPKVHDSMQHEVVSSFIRIVLDNTDKRIKEGKRTLPSFLFAALFWWPMRFRMLELINSGKHEFPAMFLAADEVLFEQNKIFILPKKMVSVIKDIWYMQLRLAKRPLKKINSTFYDLRFRAAYDFLLLRGSSGEEITDICAWWTQYTEANEVERRAMLKELQSEVVRKGK